MAQTWNRWFTFLWRLEMSWCLAYWHEKYQICIVYIRTIEGGEEDYDYDENSPRGPSQWGNLKTEWALCRDGRMQSPVDFTNVTVNTVPGSEQVYTYYQPSNTTLLNRGHDISVSTSTSLITHFVCNMHVNHKPNKDRHDLLVFQKFIFQTFVYPEKIIFSKSNKYKKIQNSKRYYRAFVWWKYNVSQDRRIP